MEFSRITPESLYKMIHDRLGRFAYEMKKLRKVSEIFMILKHFLDSM